ncbi:MAG TPA: PilZ domain-containing protein [Vicinamibacterales bacterium]|nr:PilZ domain-containing protein [Vicinamibacterales bacterium]
MTDPSELRVLVKPRHEVRKANASSIWHAGPPGPILVGKPRRTGWDNPDTEASTQMSDSEKRVAVRRPASQVPAITAIRLSPQGTRATLINISHTGVLVESASSLKPTSAVTVVFEGTFTPSSVPSRVARTTVVGIGKDGTMRYHIGLSFTKPITLEVAADSHTAPAETTAPSDASEEPPAIRNRW